MAIVDKYISHITPLDSLDTYKIRAIKLGSSDIGSATLPIYLDNGTPKPLSNNNVLINLASETEDSIYKTSPRPGITGILGITHGGTGATTAAEARTNLGLTPTNILGAGTTAQFWRGDNTWSNELTGGLLKITNNSNTVTIGSNSTAYMHFSNSADIPFYFNKSLWINGDLYPYGTTNTHSLGLSSRRWKALFIGAYDSYGGTTLPIWWNAGVPTAITTAIATAYGGTGNNTFTKNRLIWTSENTKLSSATNLWTDGTTIRFLKEDPNKLYALLQNTYNSTVYDTLVDYLNGNIVLNAASLGLYLGYSNTTYIDFIHGLGRWTNTGLGVGITSPSYKLHVVGTGYFTDTVHINKNSGSGPVDADTAPLLIGKLTGASLAIGNNAIQARSNHITSTLWFNYEGGSASFGSSTSKTVPTTFFGTVTPGANSTYDLGTTDTLRWKSGFFTTSLRVGAINTTATPNSPVNSRSVYIGPDGFYANSVNTTTTTLSNFVLRGKGVNYAKLYISQLGEVNTPGIATLTLGNNIASTADNNSNGTLLLYSNTTKYTSIKSSLEIEASHLNYLPIYGSTSSNTYYGRLVGIYKGTTSGSNGFSDVGSTSLPVYVTANGVVKAITGALGNDITGNAATATKWASPQQVYVTLGTASTTTTIQGGSASAQTIGVDGTLGTAHGGTGNTSYTASRLVYTNTATKFATGTIESDGNNIILGDGDYSLSRTAQSGNWNLGVSKALIKITSATGAYPLFAMKSHSGHWLMTLYESSNFYDHLMFGFLSDVDVYGVTNAKNHYDYKVRLIPTIYETNTETVTDRAFVTANYDSNSAQTGNTNLPIYINNLGVATAVSLKPTLNNLLSSLTEGTADALVDAGYIISSNNNGDTSDWYLRSNVTIWNYIKGKYSSTDTTLDTGPIHIRSATANENALVFDRASGEYLYIQSKNPDNNISIVFAASNSDANTTYRFTKDAFYPKANNSKDLGLSGNKWANVYATNFNGALKGNADTATKVNKTLTITLNNSAKTFNGSADTSISFYAPTAGGTANTQALVGNGATTAPKWVNISPSITITAGTASATPKVNVTVLGQSGTALAITTATTGVYGATKLTDAYTSTDATLAATGKSILAAIQTLDVAAVGVAAATGNRYISLISETDGKISATLATATIGTTTRPIWIDAGTIKPGSYELKATVNASENVNRAAYYSAKTIIKDAGSIYMDASHIGVNGTNTTYQFYVNGITKLNGHTYVGAKAAYNDTNAGWYIGTDGTIWGTHASSGAKISLYGNNKTNWIRINPTTNTSDLTLGAVEDRFTMPKLLVDSGTSSQGTSLTTQTAPLMVGPLNGTNLAIGWNAILARNNGAINSLYLNYNGGNVYIGRYLAGKTLTSQQGRLLIGSISTTAEDYSARIDLIVSDTTTGKSASSYPAYIAAYLDHASTPYGHNLVILSGGNLIIGSGESGGALYTAAIKNNTGEKLYLISDTDSYLYANGSTSANRIGILIDTSGHLLPIKAEAANSNALNIGSSTNKWASIYATTFYGTLSGNATTSSTLLGGRAHSDGTKRNWIKIATWSGSCAGANIDTSVTFSVSDGYPNPSTTPHHNGLLYINFRGNNNSTTTTRAFCDWIVGYNITPANWVLTYTITSAYAITLNLYVNSTSTWQAWNITKINEHSWGTTQNKWVLLNGTTGVANLPSGETLVVSSLKTISNNATSATKVNKTLTIKLNNSNTTFNGSADASVTFYAPAAGGTANTLALVGNGATTAPKWVNIAPSISITAGTSSATPKVNVTVLGLSGTAQSITTATTGVYGATKLTDAYTSTDATLAATGKSILAAIQTLDVSAVGVAAATGNRYISQISETDGKISAILATATIGTTTKPIWIDAGTIKACNAYPAAANTTTAVAAADSNTQGTATTWARSDHNHHLPTSGVTAGSYGPSANATPGYGVTFNVPYITVDKYGRVTAASTKTVKIPASDNTNTDTKVNYKLDTTTTKAYVMACTSAPTATATARESVGSTSVYINCSTKVLMGAAWNDYAEFRLLKENKMYATTVGPGRVVYENGDDTLSISTERLMRGCNIVSDTYGFSIGESKKAQLPIAVAGRVLAYPYESKEEFKNHIGWPVCSGPNGTVSIMTEEEEMKYPSRIIGIISAVPDYEIWHGGADVIVDGRVWIKVR